MDFLNNHVQKHVSNTNIFLYKMEMDKQDNVFVIMIWFMQNNMAQLVAEQLEVVGVIKFMKDLINLEDLKILYLQKLMK